MKNPQRFFQTSGGIIKRTSEDYFLLFLEAFLFGADFFFAAFFLVAFFFLAISFFLHI